MLTAWGERGGDVVEVGVQASAGQRTTRRVDLESGGRAGDRRRPGQAEATEHPGRADVLLMAGPRMAEHGDVAADWIGQREGVEDVDLGTRKVADHADAGDVGRQAEGERRPGGPMSRRGEWSEGVGDDVHALGTRGLACGRDGQRPTGSA